MLSLALNFVKENKKQKYFLVHIKFWVKPKNTAKHAAKFEVAWLNIFIFAACQYLTNHL